jgi:hypothetical protein
MLQTTKRSGKPLNGAHKKAHASPETPRAPFSSCVFSAT